MPESANQRLRAIGVQFAGQQTLLIVCRQRSSRVSRCSCRRAMRPDNVPELVARVERAFAALGLTDGAGELVLVDDGSTDGTGAIADELAASHPFLRVLHHRRNQGLTAALRTGFAGRARRSDPLPAGRPGV